MRILLAAVFLALFAPVASAELRYNSVVRIASSGESVDFARFQHVRPILQLTHRGSRDLPDDATVAIAASTGTITLQPDPLGAIEWPIHQDLASDNPPVTSVPDDLVAAGRVRVAATPNTRIEPSTLDAMLDEYRAFTSELSFLKRMAAPSPRGLLIVSDGPLSATSTAGRWESSTGTLRIPLEDAKASSLTFSATPRLVVLDLGLE